MRMALQDVSDAFWVHEPRQQRQRQPTSSAKPSVCPLHPHRPSTIQPSGRLKRCDDASRGHGIDQGQCTDHVGCLERGTASSSTVLIAVFGGETVGSQAQLRAGGLCCHVTTPSISSTLVESTSKQRCNMTVHREEFTNHTRRMHV